MHSEAFWATVTTNSANKFQGNCVAKKNILDPVFQCLLLGSLPIYDSQ